VGSPPDDREPYVDDWFEEDDDQTQVRQQPLRRRPGLPPPGDRRIPGIALIGGAGLLLLVVILIVAFTGNGEPETDPGQQVPTVGETPETEEPTDPEQPPEAEPPQPLPTESIIRPGDEGEQVAALQQALTTLGHDPGEPDGNYGPATVEAVRSFQTAAGLPADGIAGPTTLNAINEALAAQG
jgi:hypothetical protein